MPPLPPAGWHLPAAATSDSDIDSPGERNGPNDHSATAATSAPIVATAAASSSSSNGQHPALAASGKQLSAGIEIATGRELLVAQLAAATDHA